jgi:hypothetical protein
MGTNLLYAAGQSALSFLRIVPGARAAALGETFTSTAQGPEAVSFNPAGLSGEEQNKGKGRKQISLQHTFFVSGILYDNLVYLHPHPSGTWAAQFGFLNVTGLKRTVADPSVPDGFSEKENISTNDLLAAVFYSRNLTRRVSAGVGTKFARESLYDTSVSAAAFDLGLLYRDGNIPLDIGACLQNLGLQNTPATLRTGLSLNQRKIFLPSWVPKNSLAAIDFSRSLVSEDSTASAGIEIPFMDNRVAFRTGYRYPLAKQRLGYFLSIPNGFSLGFGLNFSGFNAGYSASSFGDLGLTHRLTLSIDIGSRSHYLPADRRSAFQAEGR